MHCNDGSRREENQRIDKLDDRYGILAGEERDHRHGKRRARSPGNGKAGTDRQIEDQDIDKGKAGMHPGRQPVKSSCKGYRHHAQHGQTHCAHGKTNERRNGRRTCLSAQKGRKDQIPRPKKHRKQGDSYEDFIFQIKFCHCNVTLSFCVSFPLSISVIPFPVLGWN